MELFRAAIETYDAIAAGKYPGVQLCVDDLIHEPLPPVGSISRRADYIITITDDGRFCGIEKGTILDESGGDGKKKEIQRYLVMPATEKAQERTSSSANPPDDFAFPLCEQVVFIADGMNAAKHRCYLNLLTAWDESKYANMFTHAVRRYVESGTILSDLAKNGIDEKKLKGGKQWVFWRVASDGLCYNCWEALDMLNDWNNFYIENYASRQTCRGIVSGNTQPLSRGKPAGILSNPNRAKLISDGDDNANCEGLFDASTIRMIGYEDNQKIHLILHWLVANYGWYYGDTVYVMWSPCCNIEPVMKYSLFEHYRNTDADFEKAKQDLYDILQGTRIQPEDGIPVIMVGLTATTLGRISVCYYDDTLRLNTSCIDYLTRWNADCRWVKHNYRTNTDSEESPSMANILRYAYGICMRDGDSVWFEMPSNKVVSHYVEQLIRCKFKGAAMPEQLIDGLVKACSQLKLYPVYLREDMLSTACAVVRIYMKRARKEVYKMTLERDSNDVSYQLGRLLAVMEHIEYCASGNNSGRETNAIRMQMAYVQKPMRVAESIIAKLKTAYFKRLTAGNKKYLDKLLEEIICKVSEQPAEANKPLNWTYLMGYYLQKRALFTKGSRNADSADTMQEADDSYDEADE